MMDLRDLIRHQKAPALAPLDCAAVWPDLAGKLFVRTPSAADLDSWDAENVKLDKGKPEGRLRNIRARFATRVIVDETGNLVFQPTDAGWLGQLQGLGHLLDRVWEQGHASSPKQEDLAAIRQGFPGQAEAAAAVSPGPESGPDSPGAAGDD
jgi:hypothetical protein